MSFIIAEDGSVIEPMIEDSSNRVFDESALRAISDWRYKPATRDGKPVEQSMVETVIRYALDESHGARAKFIAKYRATLMSINEKNLAKAATELEALGAGELNFYEQAWFSWLSYVYLASTGTAETAAQEEALRKALDSSQGLKKDDLLPPDVYVSASRRLYALRAGSGDLSGAIAAFDRLKASQNAQRSNLYKDVLSALEPSYAKILEVVAGPGILKQIARISEHDYWVHRMLRRSFAFGDVQGGDLHVVDVRCTRTNRRFVSIPRDAVLKIPESWGDCSVYIKGDVGTTFAFEEYPESYANALDPGQIPPTGE